MITLLPIPTDSEYYDEYLDWVVGAFDLPFSEPAIPAAYADVTYDSEDDQAVVLVYDRSAPTTFQSETGEYYTFNREPVDSYQGSKSQLDALTLPLTYSQLQEWYHLGH